MPVKTPQYFLYRKHLNKTLDIKLMFGNVLSANAQILYGVLKNWFISTILYLETQQYYIREQKTIS